MQLGMVGLGKMGANMARRLLAGGHNVVVFDRQPEAVERLAAAGGLAADSLPDLVERLAPPRTVWLMLPTGGPASEVVEQLAGLLGPGDTVIDGGNSHYRGSQSRAERLAAGGVFFIDVGTSGGVWGLERGYCLTIGGEPQAVERHRPLWQTLAPSADGGWGHVGPAGAGHFVKMVHNGIEYGMMQAYAEGFELLKAKQSFDLSPAQIAAIWQQGSVISSWLLELIAGLLERDESLDEVKGWVEDTGEGRWALEEALQLKVPANALAQALAARYRSRQQSPFADRLLAALRGEFGGHEVEKR